MCARLFLPRVEIKDYNVMIDGKSFFDQSVKNDLRTYNKNKNITAGKEEYYATGCLLDYTCFKENYEII